MTYREFLNRLSDEDFADAIVNDTVFDMACVESDNFSSHCTSTDLRYMKPDSCIKCIVKLLQSEFVKSDT